MNANELYSIVKPARIVGIPGETTLVRSLGIHAIYIVLYLFYNILKYACMHIGNIFYYTYSKTH
jgi:hypothetical protein